MASATELTALTSNLASVSMSRRRLSVNSSSSATSTRVRKSDAMTLQVRGIGLEVEFRDIQTMDKVTALLLFG